MSKLHQLLAVEKDRKRKATNVLQETKKVFSTKKDHFDGFVKEFKATVENAPQVQKEQKELVTSVYEKLDHTFNILTDAMDLTVSKEETNSTADASAVVVVDGKEFGKFCATSLLAMEGYFEQVLGLIKEIPTLDSTHKWEKNPDRDDIKQLAEAEIQYKTAKRSQPVVLYQATKEHPAQVQMETYDEQIGFWETMKTTGRLTPREKTEMLDRIENVLEAVKIARAEANGVKVVESKQSGAMLNYVLTGNKK